MRASIGVLGPLLARCGEARVALPGGDDFGSRPIDMHLSGARGARRDVRARARLRRGSADGLRGAPVTLEFPSVGATENILMAAALAKGTTVIDNAAREPEISDLAALLNAMGAQIEGAGTSTIQVEGVESLQPPRSTRRSLIASKPRRSSPRSRSRVARCCSTCPRRPHGHVPPQARRHGHDGHAHSRRDLGARTAALEVGRRVDAAVSGRGHRLQAAVRRDARGRRRRGHRDREPLRRAVPLCRRAGAHGRRRAHRRPPRGRARAGRLSGAPVRAPDIRAGAALVVAGLVAEGETEVSGVEHIDRGYEDFVGKLHALGARHRTGLRRSPTREHPDPFGGLPHCPSASDEGLSRVRSRSSRQSKPSGPRCRPTAATCSCTTSTRRPAS